MSTHENTPDTQDSTPKKVKQRSVVHYLSLLFGAAFFLLLLTFMMEQRNNQAVVDGLNQQNDYVEKSMATILSEKNALKDELTQAHASLSDLESQVASLQTALDEAIASNESAALSTQETITAQSNAIHALDWLRLIQVEFTDGHYQDARTLVLAFERTALPAALVSQSQVTVDGVPSDPPSAVYAQLVDELFPNGLPAEAMTPVTP